MYLTIGKPYGIQLGSLSISHEYFPVDVRNKQALDVILTAHGISYLKPPAHWAQSDLDTILLTGTELYKATKNIAIDKWSKLTKGFTYKNRFIQVTLSEPILVGKVITETERSMDLYMALERFFEHHKCGVLQTPKLDLYMIKYNAFFVFDPRGRNMDCKRDINGEAALVALTCLENVYHLIINLSKIDVKGPFKIKTLQVTQIMDSMNSTEQFTAIPGDPLKVCRSVDYQVINDRLAVLQGTIHYESKVFGNNAKKQHLAASIMSMVYAKIDPPNTWSKSVLDRVIHFGTNLYKECLSGGNIKDLKLPDIPSKFYIGETYRAGISIVPYLKRVPIEVTRMFSDNPIAIALKEILETTNFKMLLLQVDNYTFSIWQMSSTMVYYFFDGFQKDLDGAIDYFKGSSSLFMIGSIEILCQMVVEHIMQLQCRAKSLLDIHGLKITELAQLSRKEHKNRPRLKMQKMDCIRPLAADDVKQFQEVPSYIDSIMPILTANEQILMEEKIPEKPFFQQVTDLNSPSLVCCKSRIYEEIMASLQQKLPNTETPNMCSETADLVRQVHSEILRQAVYEKIPDGASFKSKSCQQENDDSKSLVGGWINECGKWTPCGKMIDVAEKVLLKSDLRCLEENRDAILKGKIPESTCETKAETNNTKSFITLSHERLIKTNFEELPDGSQIIHGTRSMFHIQLSSNIYDYENLSILVGLSAIIISTKYSIASWTPEVIDYVLGCAQLMSEALILENRMSFYTFNEHHLPVVEIKNRFYNVKMLAMENRIWSLLEQYLKNLFETIDRFLIVTSRGSFAVFMRMNFYYVFEYSTCNKLGFRIKNKEFGASCFLRFVDIHSLVRRIQSNHREVHDQQKFLVYRVITSEIKENNAHVDYVSFTESQEKDVVERLRQNRLIFKDQMIKNLKETDEKIQAEKERIRKYREETGEMIPGHITDEDLQHNDIDPNAPSNNNDFELNMSVSQQRVQSSDSDSSPMYQNYYQQMEHSFGYKIGDDGLYKIKGSFGLSKRMELAGEKSKICKFACIYAVMFAVHHPMEQMNFRSVDIILENGFKFQKLSKAGNFAKTETISGILVDKTTYELMIQEYQRQKSNDKQLLLKNKRNEKCHRDRKNMLKVTKNDDDDANSNKLKQMEQKLLNNFFAIQKYAIIQSAHCCMVIIKEKHLSSYHMFDPYDEHDDGKTEIENPLAGWIMFENVEMLLEYVNQRMIMRRHRTLPNL